MHSLIKNKLIEHNKEFKKLYDNTKLSNKLVDFNEEDQKRFESISCSKKDPSLTLAQVFSNGINHLEPGTTSLYLSETIDEDYTIHIGKLYFLRGHSQIYDCEHTWIETKTHIIDPILLIKLQIAYKEQFLYQTLRIMPKTKVDQLGYSNDEYLLFIARKLNSDYGYEDKSKEFKPMSTIDQCLSCKNDEIEGLFIRNHLLNTNDQLKDVYNIFKKNGSIIGLEETLKQMPSIICSKKNPNITLKYIFDRGLNIGNCGLVCRFFAETLNDDFLINVGICDLVKGTYSSPNGEHAWLETKSYIYDTTLMLRIPIILKEKLGYVTNDIVKKEAINPDYRTQEYIYSIDKREQMYEGATELKYRIDWTEKKK